MASHFFLWICSHHMFTSHEFLSQHLCPSLRLDPPLDSFAGRSLTPNFLRYPFCPVQELSSVLTLVLVLPISLKPTLSHLPHVFANPQLSYPPLNEHLVQALNLIPYSWPTVLHPTCLLTLNAAGFRWTEVWIVPAHGFISGADRHCQGPLAHCGLKGQEGGGWENKREPWQKWTYLPSRTVTLLLRASEDKTRVTTWTPRAIQAERQSKMQKADTQTDTCLVF